MSHKTHAKAIAKLEGIYATLPAVACRGLCSIACGPILMSELEAERMKKADAQKRLPTIRADLTCIYLTASKRCGVYAVRPLICRVWGVVKRMSCMHGCEPARWLSDHEFVEIAKAIERIGGQVSTTALAGVTRRLESFLDLDTSSVPVELADALAERTRGLRALHGGRIVGLVPTPPGEEPRTIDLDREHR